MGKFKAGDLVRIIAKGSLKYGSSASKIRSADKGNVIKSYDPDLSNSYVVEIYDEYDKKTNYRFAESELELYGNIPVTESLPSFPKQGFRKFKINDIVTIHPDLTGLFFGGLNDVRGLKGRVVNVGDSISSSKTRSQYIVVEFGTLGKYSMFESETLEFHNALSAINESQSKTYTSDYSSEYVDQRISLQRNQGQVIRAHVGASVVIPKIRYPQVIISNTKTIIQHGRGNTGRKVQSTHF
jgi:hypothetical protein